MDCPAITTYSNLANKYNKFDHPHQIYQIQEIVAEKNLYMQILLKQQAYVSEQVEFLKRFYQLNEFGYKIDMLSEYYKFHRNVPKIFDIGVEDTLNKYYNKYRHLDYKNMKQVLKQQQNVSITTQKSQSSYSMSICEKKSKYSDMLGPLKQTQNDSDSQFLWNFCSDTQKNFKKKKDLKKNMNEFFSCSPIHGQDARFQKYLQDVGKKYGKNQSKFRKTMLRKPSQCFERISQHQNLQAYKPRIKRNNCGQPIKKSIQKTTNNQTMSREQKQKQSIKIDMKNPYKTLRTQFKKKLNNRTLQIKKDPHPKTKKLLRKKSQLRLLQPTNNSGPMHEHCQNILIVANDQQNLQEQRKMSLARNSTGMLRKNKGRSLKKRLTGQVCAEIQTYIDKPLQTDRRKSKSCHKGFQSTNRQASVPILKPQKTLNRKQSSKKLIRVASVTKKHFQEAQQSCKENQYPITKGIIEKQAKNLNLQALLHKKLDLFKPHKIF